MSALQSSGVSMAAFAARHGLDAQRLRGWRRRLGAGVTTDRSFVEVVARPEIVTGRHEFEIELVSGDRVHVPSNFDADALRRLIAVLRRVAAC